MRRPLVALAVAIVAIGVLTGGLAWLLDTPKPPPGAGRDQRIWFGFCASCHGVDGRGSWRAALFLVRPGDLTNATRIASVSDQYLFDLIKHGGAPIGRPGMPAFGSTLSDEDITLLVRHVRRLSKPDQNR
jgi:mono/diheme cytochrome c family protein